MNKVIDACTWISKFPGSCWTYDFKKDNVTRRTVHAGATQATRIAYYFSISSCCTIPVGTYAFCVRGCFLLFFYVLRQHDYLDRTTRTLENMNESFNHDLSSHPSFPDSVTHVLKSSQDSLQEGIKNDINDDRIDLDFRFFPPLSTMTILFYSIVRPMHEPR